MIRKKIGAVSWSNAPQKHIDLYKRPILPMLYASSRVSPLVIPGNVAMADLCDNGIFSYSLKVMSCLWNPDFGYSKM